MKKITFLLILTLCFNDFLVAQNVGIGTTTPNQKLMVIDSLKTKTSLKIGAKTYADTTQLIFSNRAGLFGTDMVISANNEEGLRFFSNSDLPNNTNPLIMQITPQGNVGIGISPSATLDVFKNGANTTANFRGSINTSHFNFGAGEETYIRGGKNTSNVLIGGGSNRIIMETNVGIGTTTANAPLSFSNNLGNKISLWGDAAGNHHGIGIQGGLMQFYTPDNVSDIVFGFGNSASFTPNMIIKGNGSVGIGTNSPDLPLDLLGSLKIRNAVNGEGIRFTNNNTNGDNGSIFLGLHTNNNTTLAIGNPAFFIPGFGTFPASSKFMFDVSDGTMRIGTTQKATGFLLNVGGKAICEELKIQLKANWPDYVFSDNYPLIPLNDVKQFIGKNKHLPGFPAAAEIENANGFEVGDTQRKLLQKIEELQLYILQLHERIQKLENK